MNPMTKITSEEFENRLAAQCLNRGGRGLPRKERDKHVLYKSILLTIEPDRDYPEKELNEALKKWLHEVGKAIEIDHVTLRRHLIDEGYLSRDQAGTAYRVQTEHMADLFEPETNSIDPAAVIAMAEEIRDQKRREFQNRKQ
jgi:hypothetical protein